MTTFSATSLTALTDRKSPSWADEVDENPDDEVYESEFEDEVENVPERTDGFVKIARDDYRMAWSYMRQAEPEDRTNGRHYRARGVSRQWTLV